MRVLIGTSGYNYDAWKGRFYPDGLPSSGRLAYYAERLPTVEIDSTYYRIPAPSVFASWDAQTPDSFCFSVKASRRITHHARLKPEAEDTTKFFLTRAAALGVKLGAILFQLPPNLKKDLPRLAAFLATLPSGTRSAFEFRHASWFDDEVYAALRGSGAALCIAESEDLATPLVATAPYGYLRLRREDYGEPDLDRWAARIRDAGWTEDVLVYFKHEDEARGVALTTGLARRLGMPE